MTYRTEAQMIAAGGHSDSIGRPCASYCESANANNICSYEKLLSSSEEITKEFDVSKTSFDVSKKVVKSGGEWVTFAGYFPPGSSCRMSDDSGGQNQMNGPVSEVLFVKN